MHEHAGKAELLLHATGQGTGQAVGKRRETGRLQQGVDARRAAGPRHPVQVRVELEVLANGQVLVQTESLGHVPDPGTQAGSVGSRVQPEHPHLPRVRDEQTGAQTHPGRLAGAVRAHEPRHLPGGEGRGDALEGDDTLPARDKRLDDARQFDDGGRRTHPQGAPPDPVASDDPDRPGTPAPGPDAPSGAGAGASGIRTVAGIPSRNSPKPSDTSTRTW